MNPYSQKDWTIEYFLHYLKVLTYHDDDDLSVKSYINSIVTQSFIESFSCNHLTCGSCKHQNDASI